MQEPKYYALSFSCSKRLQAASAEEMGLTSVPVVSGEAGSFSHERTEHYASDLGGLAAYLLSDDALCMNLLVAYSYALHKGVCLALLLQA